MSGAAMDRRSSRRRILTFVALWIAISAAALLAPGCYGRNCEGGFETYGPDAGQGFMVDENRWASGPMDGTWLWFPRQRYYIFDVRAFGGRAPTAIFPYISGTPEPTKNGGNYAPAAGNLAEIFSGPNRFDIKNDSCSDYYLYVVVDLPPLPPEAPADDAGADAGIADASGEEDAAADAGDAEAGP